MEKKLSICGPLLPFIFFFIKLDYIFFNMLNLFMDI